MMTGQDVDATEKTENSAVDVEKNDAVSEAVSAEEKKDSLKLRVISSIGLGSITLAGVYYGGALFAAVVAFLVVMMSFEWTRMVEGKELTSAFVTLALTGGASIASAAMGYYSFSYGICMVGGLIASVAAHRFLPITPPSDHPDKDDQSSVFHPRRGLKSLIPSVRFPWVGFGALYFIAPSIALLWLREDVENGLGLTFLLFFIVWSADIGAYFAGRFIGGPRLSPSLSPMKTWSGAIAGVLAGAACGALGAGVIFGEGEIGVYVLMGASLGAASILGDMTESAFKRTFNVKDASGLIPGHGGVLDRLDGMIFATTALTLVLFIHIIASPR